MTPATTGLNLNHLTSSPLWIVVAQAPDGSYTCVAGGRSLRSSDGELARACVEGIVHALTAGDTTALEAAADILSDDEDYEVDPTDPSTPEA